VPSRSSFPAKPTVLYVSKRRVDYLISHQKSLRQGKIEKAVIFSGSLHYKTFYNLSYIKTLTFKPQFNNSDVLDVTPSVAFEKLASRGWPFINNINLREEKQWTEKKRKGKG
jgi:hypothetical protein